MIYAIAATAKGPVKWGRATDIKTRFQSIQTSNFVNLDLSVIIPTTTKEEDMVVEKFIHSLLADSNVRGEWYKYDPSIKLIRMINRREDTKKAIIKIAEKYAMVQRVAYKTSLASMKNETNVLHKNFIILELLNKLKKEEDTIEPVA